MSDNNGAAQLWTTAQTELRLQFTPDIYEMYIRPLRLVDMNEAGEISLACPNTFTRDWLEQRLDRVVSRTCSAIAGRTITTRYLLAPAGQLPLVSDGQPTDRGENGDGSSSFYVRPGDLRPASASPASASGPSSAPPSRSAPAIPWLATPGSAFGPSRATTRTAGGLSSTPWLC